MASRPPPSSSSSSNGERRQPKASPGDFIARGDYSPSPLGTATFIGLRALDPLLQYRLLVPATGLLTSLLSSPKLNISAIPTSVLPSLTLFQNITLPLPHWILLALSATASFKQILWSTYISRESFGPGAAVSVGIFNSAVNAINSLLLVTNATSAALDRPQVTLPLINQPVSLTVAIGAALFFTGIVLETIPELQRKWFKDDPKNKGKICDVGLWGWARHINYGGYTIWRAGYGLAAGGWATGILMAAWQVYHFAANSMGPMDEYMVKRYGSQWEEHRKKVKWLLIPGIY